MLFPTRGVKKGKDRKREGERRIERNRQANRYAFLFSLKKKRYERLIFFKKQKQKKNGRPLFSFKKITHKRCFSVIERFLKKKQERDKIKLSLNSR